MSSVKRTATEASAVTAIAVAVTLATSGAYIAAGVAALMGVALFFAYEHLQIETITLDPELIERVSKSAEDEIEDAVDDMKEKK
jgi:hypothetical protein